MQENERWRFCKDCITLNPTKEFLYFNEAPGERKVENVAWGCQKGTSTCARERNSRATISFVYSEKLADKWC